MDFDWTTVKQGMAFRDSGMANVWFYLGPDVMWPKSYSFMLKHPGSMAACCFANDMLVRAPEKDQDWADYYASGSQRRC